MLKNTIIATALLWLSVPCFSQYGPGGILSTSENRFWFDSSSLNNVLDDGDEVSTWNNAGGNALNAYEVGGRRPEFTMDEDFILNGFAGIYFDGSDDQLKIDNNSDINTYSSSDPVAQRSFTLVFNVGEEVEERQVIYEEGGKGRGINVFIEDEEIHIGAYNLISDGAGAPWDYQYISGEIEEEETYVLTLVLNGNEDIDGTLNAWLNGEHLDEVDEIGLLYPHSGAISIGSMRGNSYFYDEQELGSGFHFEGLLYEFVMFNTAINQAQRIILENHLSAKFGLYLEDNDVYSMDHYLNGNYDFDVSGIGMSDYYETQTWSRGAGILEVGGAYDLEEEEFFIWGHNNADLSWTDDDAPDEVEFMLERSWKASESGGNLGNMNIGFDLSGISYDSGAQFRLLVDTNDDGDFSDESPNGSIPTFDSGTQTLRFSSVDIGGGTAFTLGWAFFFLPVEFGSFDAKKQGDQVQITWSTYAELNNELFQVQRSTDLSEWRTIQYINGAGTSTVQMDYEIWDRSPENGVNYYRVKQVDYNGDFDFSETRSVQFNKANSLLTIQPNPAVDEIYFQTTLDQIVEVNITDLSGKIVFQQSFHRESNKRIDLKHFPPGMYLFQAKIKDETFTERFIKK